MVMKSILPLYSPSSLTRSGNSSRHGTHQVAQKLISRGLVLGLINSAYSAWPIFVTFGRSAGIGLGEGVRRWASIEPTNRSAKSHPKEMAFIADRIDRLSIIYS